MIGYYQRFLNEEEQKFHFFSEKDLNFLPHMHQQYEFIYVLEGELMATVDSSTRMLGKGDAVFIMKNRVHSYSTPKYCKYFLAIFHPEKIAAVDRMLRRKEVICQFLELGCKREEIEFCIRQMLAEKEGSNMPYVLDGYLSVLTGRIFQSLELRDGAVPHDNSTQKVLTYICENFDRPINLDTLAAEVGLSRFHLSRIFNRQIGYSFSHYLNYLRVSYAKRLLQDTAKPVSEICFDCGFESMRTFNRAFRELTGDSPSVFRSRGAIGGKSAAVSVAK